MNLIAGHHVLHCALCPILSRQIMCIMCRSSVPSYDLGNQVYAQLTSICAQLKQVLTALLHITLHSGGRTVLIIGREMNLPGVPTKCILSWTGNCSDGPKAPDCISEKCLSPKMSVLLQSSFALGANAQSLTCIKNLSLLNASKCTINSCLNQQPHVILLHNEQIADESFQQFTVAAAKEAFSSCCWQHVCILLSAGHTLQSATLSNACCRAQ